MSDAFETVEVVELEAEEPVERPLLTDHVDPKNIVETTDPDLQEEQEAALSAIESPEPEAEEDPDA